MENLFWILKNLLENNQYQFSDQIVKERLFSDPENEVLTITNTLDYLKINNLAANVPKNSFSQLPEYFIAKLEKGEHSAFALIIKRNDYHVTIQTNRNNTFILSNEEFLTEWNGFVVAIDENSTIKTFDKYKKLFIPSLTCIVVTLMMIFFYFTTSSFSRLLYLLLSVIGVGVSYLTIKEKLGIETITSRFCTMSKKTDCSSVINSKEAKLLGVLDLSDMSLVYFSFVTIAFFIYPYSVLFGIASCLSVPIILYSIFYQVFVIRKLCPLCISVASLLCLQFIVMLFTIKSYSFNYLDLLLLSSLLVGISVTWFILKPILIKSVKHDNLVIENLKFRRNYNLFIAYYNTLEIIDTSNITPQAIQIGSPSSLINITAVTNPLCKMCSEAHHTYLQLMKKYPDTIKINFLFLVPFKNRDDFKTRISERLLQFYHEEELSFFMNAFNDWYEYLNAEEWIRKWGECDDEKYNTILLNQVRWCLDNDITNTPILLVNEKLFPESYLPADLECFTEHIMEQEKEKINNTENIHA